MRVSLPFHSVPSSLLSFLHVFVVSLLLAETKDAQKEQQKRAEDGRHMHSFPCSFVFLSLLVPLIITFAYPMIFQQGVGRSVFSYVSPFLYDVFSPSKA